MTTLTLIELLTFDLSLSFLFTGKTTCEALKTRYRANTAATEACNASRFQAYKGRKTKTKGVIEDDECE